MSGSKTIAKLGAILGRSGEEPRKEQNMKRITTIILTGLICAISAVAPVHAACAYGPQQIFHMIWPGEQDNERFFTLNKGVANIRVMVDAEAGWFAELEYYVETPSGDIICDTEAAREYETGLNCRVNSKQAGRYYVRIKNNSKERYPIGYAFICEPQ